LKEQNSSITLKFGEFINSKCYVDISVFYHCSFLVSIRLIVAIHVFNPSLCAALGYKVFPHFADIMLYVEFEGEAICDHHSLQVRTPSFAPSPTPTQSVNITKSPTPGLRL
jgi:hypothetical protein